MSNSAFALHQSGLTSPPSWAAAVTPDDNVDLPKVPRALECRTDGTVVCIMLDDTVAVTRYIIAGTQLSGLVRRVLASGTTATGIVAVG